MSTRALFTFSDSDKNWGILTEFHVYKHFDGYPSGAYEAIEKSLEYAWDLARFEAADFSAAFIAANKKLGGGGIYLSSNSHGNLGYCYEISNHLDGSGIYIKCFKVEDEYKELIFSGDLSQFKKYIIKN